MSIMSFHLWDCWEYRERMSLCVEDPGVQGDDTVVTEEKKEVLEGLC